MVTQEYAVDYVETRGFPMFLTGQETRLFYGKIVSWADDMRSRVDECEGTALTLGEGLLILEMQERIYSFLAGMCFPVAIGCRLLLPFAQCIYRDIY